MAILDRIKSIGHFFVRVHPAEPIAEGARPGMAELESIITNASVQLRGWDFPHIDRNQQFERHDGYISQSSEWWYHLESWRLYASGQFAARVGLIEDVLKAQGEWPGPRRPNDWETQPYVGAIEVAYRAAETAHLAASLGSTALGGASSVIQFELLNTQGRRLYVEDPWRAGFVTAYEAHDPTVTVVEVVETLALETDPWRTAVDLARKTYEMFGWDPELSLVSGLLDPLRGG